MAAREYEEEQTQRTMLSLNTLEPSYPGKNKKEIEKIIEEVSLLYMYMHVLCPTVHVRECIKNNSVYVSVVL